MTLQTLVIIYQKLLKFRCGSTTAVTTKMELFVIIVNGFQPLPIITMCSILDVAAVPDSLQKFLLEVYHNTQENEEFKSFA